MAEKTVMAPFRRTQSQARLARQKADRQRKVAEAKQDIGYDRLVKFGEQKKADTALSRYEEQLRTGVTGRSLIGTPRQLLEKSLAGTQQGIQAKELQALQREELRERAQEEMALGSRIRRRSRGARSLMLQAQPTQDFLGSAGTLG